MILANLRSRNQSALGTLPRRKSMHLAGPYRVFVENYDLPPSQTDTINSKIADDNRDMITGSSGVIDPFFLATPMKLIW